MKKYLNNTDISDAKVNVPDIEVFGNGDLWQLLCKASSKSEGWMKSTKAMEIRDFPVCHIEGMKPSVHGCLVQVTTQHGKQVAEALVFVPGVRIEYDENGHARLERCATR